MGQFPILIIQYSSHNILIPLFLKVRLLENPFYLFIQTLLFFNIWFAITKGPSIRSPISFGEKSFYSFFFQMLIHFEIDEGESSPFRTLGLLILFYCLQARFLCLDIENPKLKNPVNLVRDIIPVSLDNEGSSFAVLQIVPLTFHVLQQCGNEYGIFYR